MVGAAAGVLLLQLQLLVLGAFGLINSVPCADVQGHCVPFVPAVFQGAGQVHSRSHTHDRVAGSCGRLSYRLVVHSSQ